MNRTRVRRWTMSAVVAVAVLAAALAASSSSSIAARTSAAPPPPAADELPECPRDWGDRMPKWLGGRRSEAEGFSVPGPITDVPEFHDCQRLIRRDHSFGPLVAIFAAYYLDSLESLLAVSPTYKGRTPADSAAADSLRRRGATVALAGALILNGNRELYDPLYIQPKFSCLYLWKDAAMRWRARIVPVDTAQSLCLGPKDPTRTVGTDLTVTVDRVPGFTSDDYPPVARWDWDSTASQHYIGIKCGAAWCEIGREGMHASATHVKGFVPHSARARIQRIKGWYDEQHLAMRAADGSWRPGSAVGTIFPDSSLVSRTLGDYTAKWDTVAYVALSDAVPYYEQVLNLRRVSAEGPLPSMNIFLMCYGTAAHTSCNVPAATSAEARVARCATRTVAPMLPRMWMKIIPAGGGIPLYRCVTWRHHDIDKSIPGTTRWRWLAADETTWAECVHGCCESEVNGQDV